MQGQCGACDSGFYTARNEQKHLGFECLPCPDSVGPTLVAAGAAMLLLGLVVLVAVKLKKRALLFLLLIASQFFQLSFITMQINGLSYPLCNFVICIRPL